ncbi:MAG: 2-hydroxychromene-2-carboxylate isomerase [Alphaproteobacteria bacterium]|nr:2-hydroxychromene-2-carboxylate isomerase [Alphaproteobacteria bacterium]
MPAPIDFYFDFSSPYGYFAAKKIDELAARHKREVNWRPFLLGAVFKITKMQPLVEYPIKSDYMTRDWARFARLLGVPFKPPEVFPFSGVNASRLFYWLQVRDAELARNFARRAFHAAFGEGRDIVSIPALIALAESLGVPAGDIMAANSDPTVKEQLRTEVEAAIARGVFGSPYVVVDGEPFWGADRLDQVDGWLATGGW